MRQQDFDFVLEASATVPIPLDPRTVEDVVKLMATAIVAVYFAARQNWTTSACEDRPARGSAECREVLFACLGRRHLHRHVVRRPR